MSALSYEVLGQINYWAVAVAALLTFFLGGLWYSPVLFEEAWKSSNGYSSDDTSAILAGLVPLGFVSVFLAYLAMATVLAIMISALGIDGLRGGLLLGTLLWLGFFATAGLAINLFSLRPMSSWLIDAGFQFVYLLMCSSILSAWR